MNGFAILSLLSFLMLTVLSIGVFFRNPKSWTNRLYSMLHAVYAVQTFIEFGYRQSLSQAQAAFWWRIDVVWPFGIALNLYFTLVFTKNSHLLRRYWVHGLIVGPAIIAFLTEILTAAISAEPVRNYWGWSYQLQTGGRLARIVYIWMVTVFLTSLVLAVRYLLNTTDGRKRRQAKLLAAAVAVGLVSVIFEGIVSAMGWQIPQLSGASFLLAGGLFGWAIWKYDMFALTPITVAENIVAAMADSLLLVNTRFEIESCNSAALRLLEYEEKEFLGRPANGLFERSVRKPRWLVRADIDCDSDEIDYIDTRFRSRTGKGVPVWLASSPLYDHNGFKIGYLMIARDITERNRREQELQVFKNHLENLVAQRTSELKRSLENLEKTSLEKRRVEKERKDLEEERASLEQQLYHAQKLESIGRLAGGVAHDFNNLLFVINTYSEGFLSNLSKSDPLYHDFKEIHQAATRATALTQQLLAFSRKQITRPVVIDPNEAVKQLQRMLKRLIGEHIYFNVVPGINVGKIKIDPGQLDQIMMNLAVNARDAMPSGGTITVEINQTRLSRAQCRERGDDVIPGPYVFIKFRDTGTGMDADTLSKIFDPFFSTKAPGKGTGLGLSTIYGIVKQNGGFVDVESVVGQGTTFTICFRKYAPELGDAFLPDAGLAALEGSETILIVEDDDQVRHLAARLLRQLGYNVIEASSASEATAVFHECRNDIDLLFTDIVMPGMNGKQLSRLLGVTKPCLKVLYMSGYNEEIVDNMGQLAPNTAFIAKPFTSNDLSMKIREVLDADGS